MAAEDPWAQSWRDASETTGSHPSAPSIPPAPPAALWTSGSHSSRSRSRVGLVALAIALVLAGVVVAGVSLLRDGDDPASGSSRDAAVDPVPLRGSDRGAGASTDRDDREVADPDNTGRVAGRGYGYALPPGWNEGTDTADLPGMIDTLSGIVPDDGRPPSSLIVEALPAPGATPEDIRAPWIRNATQPDGIEPVDIEGITIAGSRAIGLAFRDRPSDFGVPMDQIGYLMVHDGRAYAVGFTYPADDPGAKAVLRSILASWSWSA